MTTDTLVRPRDAVRPDPAELRARLVRQALVDSGYSLLPCRSASSPSSSWSPAWPPGSARWSSGSGVAVLAATLLAARGLAALERAQLPAVLDRRSPGRPT
jgi:hypothetical protein